MRFFLLPLIFFFPALVSAQVHFSSDSLTVPPEVSNIYVHKIGGDSLSSTFYIVVKEDVAMHRHENHSESVVVLKGTAKMILADENIEIKAGDILFIPKGTWHSVKVTSEVPLEIISVQAPYFDGSDRILYKKN